MKRRAFRAFLTFSSSEVWNSVWEHLGNVLAAGMQARFLGVGWSGGGGVSARHFLHFPSPAYPLLRTSQNKRLAVQPHPDRLTDARVFLCTVASPSSSAENGHEQPQQPMVTNTQAAAVYLTDTHAHLSCPLSFPLYVHTRPRVHRQYLCEATFGDISRCDHC